MWHSLIAQTKKCSEIEDHRLQHALTIHHTPLGWSEIIAIAGHGERFDELYPNRDEASIDTWPRCANLDSPAQCNWLVTGVQDQHDSGDLAWLAR